MIKSQKMRRFKLSNKSWKIFELWFKSWFEMRMTLNMLFSSSLASCIPRFAWRVWRPRRSSSSLIKSGTKVSIRFARKNLANCEPWTRPRCSRMAISKSTIFCGRGRGGWFLAARATTVTYRVDAYLITLDLAIIDETHNWEFGDLRKGDWYNAKSNQNTIDFCV